MLLKCFIFLTFLSLSSFTKVASRTLPNDASEGLTDNQITDNSLENTGNVELDIENLEKNSISQSSLSNLENQVDSSRNQKEKENFDLQQIEIDELEQENLPTLSRKRRYAEDQSRTEAAIKSIKRSHRVFLNNLKNKNSYSSNSFSNHAMGRPNYQMPGGGPSGLNGAFGERDVFNPNMKAMILRQRMVQRQRLQQQLQQERNAAQQMCMFLKSKSTMQSVLEFDCLNNNYSNVDELMISLQNFSDEKAVLVDVDQNMNMNLNNNNNQRRLRKHHMLRNSGRYH